MYLLILSGMSGAGKSLALNRLEDSGFFCVDNLPSQMLAGFVDLCVKTAPCNVERAAVVIDSRESVFGADIDKTMSELTDMGVRYEILFLDCRDEVLERRYNETRRRHPMNEDIREGIRKERALLTPLREIATYVLDTSDLKPLQMGVKLLEIVSETIGSDFLLTVESFGYKRGVPLEADIVFDMRFSPNPYYEPELKHLSGVSAAVKEYVKRDPIFWETLDRIESLLRLLIPRYIQQDKHRLIVGFGCTGGRHRSVLAAQEMYERMCEDYRTRLVHRDTQIEAGDIASRSGDIAKKE